MNRVAVLAGALLVAGPVPGAVETGSAAGGAGRPEPVEVVAAAFPPEVDGAVLDGFALVGCLVDEDGSVLEAWSLAASAPPFATAAERALMTWSYAPAGAVDAGAAVAWPRLDVVRFDFTRRGGLVPRTHREAVAAAFAGGVPDAREELPPQVLAADLKRVAGRLPPPEPGLGEGRVMLEFLVDRGGVVRLPVAVSATTVAHARVAVAAARTWRFAPPEVPEGRAAVRVRWGLRFRG